MNIQQAVQLMKPYLLLLAPEIRKELTVATPQSVGVSHLLHLSKSSEIKRFVPGISRRGSHKEDRTVPRISTAPSLLGCLLGYASDIFDFHDRGAGLNFSGKKQVPFKGGYTIYGFPFQAALKPSSFLVPDTQLSDEHWLVPYDSEHSEYHPIQIGKVFYKMISYEVNESRLSKRVEMYVEVNTEIPIWVDGTQRLTRGYWMLTVYGLHEGRAWNDMECRVTPITTQDYTACKRNVASLLSFEDTAAALLNW